MSKRKHRIRDTLPEGKAFIKGYPREHYNADRSPKMQYKTYASARGVARHMFNKTGELLEPYQCQFCGCWHLGHVVELKPDTERLRTRQVIENELTVLKGYKHDLTHVQNEVAALMSKIEKLETTIYIHYHELTKEQDEEFIRRHYGLLPDAMVQNSGEQDCST